MQNEIFKLYLRETERELDMKRKKNPTILLPLPQGVVPIQVPIQPETPKVPQAQTQVQPETSESINDRIKSGMDEGLEYGKRILEGMNILLETIEAGERLYDKYKKYNPR